MTVGTNTIKIGVLSIVLIVCALFAFLPKQRQSLSELRKLQRLDVRLPEPKPGDWLYVRHEKGQTFEQYIAQQPFRPTKTVNTIYLLPIGNFSDIERQLIQHTADYLTIFFDRHVVILPTVNDSIVPANARRRDQLQTGFILDMLESRFPKDGIAIMAITDKDLYPSARYNFVFGQARPKTRVGVSSFFRYVEGELSDASYPLCLSRMIKTSSHEIGHMLSCMHCTHAVCLMNGSNSLPESDSRPNRLCSECLGKLHWNLDFAISDRVSKLSQYFKRHGLEGDYKLSMQDMRALSAQ